MNSGDSRSGQMECQISSHSRSCAPRITWMCTWHSHHHSRVSWVQKVSSHIQNASKIPVPTSQFRLYHFTGQHSDPRCIYVPPATGKKQFSFRIAYSRCGTKPDLNGQFYENTVRWAPAAAFSRRVSSLVGYTMIGPDTIHNAHDEMKKENIYTRNWDTQQTAMRLNR